MIKRVLEALNTFASCIMINVRMPRAPGLDSAINIIYASKVYRPTCQLSKDNAGNTVDNLIVYCFTFNWTLTFINCPFGRIVL